MATLVESKGNYYVKFRDIDRKWKTKYLGKIKGYLNPETGKRNVRGLLKREAEHKRKIIDGQELCRIHDAPLRKVDLLPADALDEYYNTAMSRGKKRQIAPNTIRNYKVYIKYFKIWFAQIGIKKMSSLKVEHVKSFVFDCSDLCQQSLRLRQGALLRFLKWCDIKGYWQGRRELETIETIEKEKPKVRYLSVKDLHRVFDAAPEKYKNAIKFHYYVGARVGEVGFLKWSDYNDEQQTITFPIGDGLKPRNEGTVFVCKSAIELLKEQRKITGEKTYIFENSRGNRLTGRTLADVEKRIFESLNLDETSHVLRHSFASQLASNGATLLQIKTLMRHSDIKDTMIYAHLTQSAQKAALELLPV